MVIFGKHRKLLNKLVQVLNFDSNRHITLSQLSSLFHHHPSLSTLFTGSFPQLQERFPLHQFQKIPTKFLLNANFTTKFIMINCDSSFSLFLDFLSRRLNHSPAYCDSGDYDSSRILRDYAVREFNLLLWLFLFAITGLLIQKIWKLLILWSQGCLIPGPPSPSFYGHSQLFCGSNSHQNLVDLLVKSHKKYGSVVKLWLSPTQLLVSLKDPSLINEMLSKAVDKVPLTGRVFPLALGQSNFFVSSFEKFKKRREFLGLDLNGLLFEETNSVTNKVVDFAMEKFGCLMDKGTLDCGLFSQHIAFSIVGSAFFGDAFLNWSQANVYKELLIKIANDACFWASYRVVPFWKWDYWKYQLLCMRLKCLTKDIVQQCRMNYDLMCHPNGNKNTMSRVGTASDMVYSSTVVKVEQSNSQASCDRLNLLQPCGNVLEMMCHGCLTTASLIGSMLARLVMHPEIQQKIYSEVVMVRSRFDKLKKQDINEMHLLLATVYESARFLPAGPLLQRCSLWQDLELKNGMRVPAGAMLVAPIQLVQMDEVNWGSDARQFNPYRFLSKVENQSELERSPKTSGADGEPGDMAEMSYFLSDPIKNAAFLPFGSGLRACVGQRFAVLEIASIFASLLERYEIKLHPGSNLDPKPSMINCVLQLVPSPNIVFVQRDG